ncbi:hypothetical protein FisN_7Hh069 [Fistulifera solaris]|uniref:2Fe-2S ferredoxin-type domain-containing protein n=1 Tax=Fistulifera solaris TaxID=1519565 RepID=A0A1Z5K458_FISSO|nr:hypothetical protein FisN_7Hh069 [Fistulifera solaris]|eukprot:GAX20758.1 hypothetical protein FisN_7Hh069 [Fistulifera solaris]
MQSFAPLICLLVYSTTDAFVVKQTSHAHPPSALHSSAAGIPVTMIESVADAMSGAGPIQVDMNQYNLDPDIIANEWTAVLQPATPLQDEGIYLQAKNKREILVDTVKIKIPRREGKGLGLELLELAGGREDGLGITVVSGLVEGGCADGSEIMVGDSISKLQVIDTQDNEIVSVSTECLSYDGTVDAVLSLPPAEDGQSMVITLKRLRRKPKVQVTIQYPPSMKEKDVTIELFSGENLRRSMLIKGIKLNDPLARRFDSGGTGSCGAEGTCGTCSVSILRGQELLSPPGQTEQQMFRNNPRWRLSCKARVGYGLREGELVVRVNPGQWEQ